MSILNGLGAAGSTLSAAGAAAAQDAIARSSLLNNATPDAAAPADAGTQAATPPAKAAVGPAATRSAPIVNVPVDLLPIYQAAAARTGIPVNVLIAQGKQESNFSSDAVGSAGEIGLHQIKPSTASAPGYGLKGIDPATLKDPTVNINFAADYLLAKAGNPNFNDPASIDAALAAYNGGGDKNYVANVRQYMGASS